MKLDFIIIGGQKCGSSYLHNVISQHPDVDMIPDECAHFESPDYEDRGVEKLMDLLKELNQEKLIGIKRPNYLAKPEVPARIQQANKNIKLIAILRNPIDRLKSAYFHSMRNGFSPILSLDQGVEKLLKGDLAKNYPRTDELIEFGLYFKHLKEYKTLFGERLLVLTYDQLLKDKKKVIKKCYTFLGVDNGFIPYNSIDSRPQKVTYSLLRTWFLNKKNKHLFTYNKPKTRLFLKTQSRLDRFSIGCIDWIDRLILQRISKGNKKPEFNDSIKEQLLELYRQDIDGLETLLNIDLSLWKE